MYENFIKHYLQLAQPNDPMDFMHSLTKNYARNKLDADIIKCNKCKICNSKHKTITKGDTNSELLIIGSHPSYDETDTHYPFELNTVKEKLNIVYDFYNIDINYIFYTNLINCWPQTDNIARAPSLKEVNNCSKYTRRIIDIVKPFAILLFGPAPYNALKDPEFYNSFNNIKGEWTSIMGIPAMVTYNIYDFDNPNKWDSKDDLQFAKEDFVDHFVLILEKIKEQYPDNNLIKGEQ